MSDISSAREAAVEAAMAVLGLADKVAILAGQDGGTATLTLD